MSLKKLLSYVERYASKTSMQGDYVAVPADNEDFTVSLLANRMSVHYPDCKIDRFTQKFDYLLTKNYTIDGDMLDEYKVKIYLSDEFLEEFTEKYPEGLI